MSPNCWPRRTSRTRSTRRVDQGETGDPAAGAAQLGRAGQELRIQEEPNSRDLRGYAADPGGGLEFAAGRFRAACRCSDLLKSDMWIRVIAGQDYEFQSSIFQPKGGMGMIGKAFGKAAGPADQVQLQGHRHPSGRQGRHRHLYRQPEGRRAAESHRRLVRLHHSRFDPVADSDECRRADDEGGDQPAAL